MTTATEVINGSSAPAKLDYASDQEVRWCPGCGDYSILKQVETVLREKGLPKEDIVFISGIGCSSRFPYYLDTYGMHSIHGRAPAIVSGLRAVRPDLSVWMITGDGDSLSIGGNHLIHLLRRNVDVNVLLFNNEIYGLTKGQYSPTSPEGAVTKSTPMGSVDHPFNPLALCKGADATFLARAMDRDPKQLREVLLRADAHRGTSLVEIYQNCNVFNDGAFETITAKSARDDMLIPLVHGRPIRFGAEGQFGVVMNDHGSVEVVEVATVGESALLVHDETDAGLAFQLSRLSHGPTMPTPIGIFRRVERPDYGAEMNAQLAAEVERRGPGDLSKLLRSGATWMVS